MKNALLAFVLISWLLACDDGAGLDWETAADTWHSGADEELIAFLRRNEENTESKIFVMRPDGSNVRPQGGGGMFVDRYLQWSPDGTSLGYIGDHHGSGIYIMSANGMVRKPLGSVWRLDNDLHMSPHSFAWSPDGMFVAFESHDFYGHWGGSRIYVSPVNSSEVFTTIPMVDTIDLFDIQPSWSPDGTKIAFISDRARDGQWDIFLMNPDGTGLQRLTDFPIHQHGPVWSPDGKKIAFTGASMEGGGASIYVMGADGTGLFQVTHHLGSSPTWSPDGTRLAFTSDHEGNSEIYVINIDGTGLKRLTNDPRPDYSPSWSRGKRR
jgi:Tol biopolymer transport system component